MKKRRNDTNRASALHGAPITALMLLAALLLAITSTTIAKNTSQSSTPELELEQRLNGDLIKARSYPDISVPLSGNTTVTPHVPPTNTTSINVSTSTSFKGVLDASPTTGVVRVTDAHPAGTYTVAVRAFNGDSLIVTKRFTLTVTTPAVCSPVSFAPATAFTVDRTIRSIAIGDFDRDGKQDLAVGNGEFSTPGNVSILLGNGSGSFSALVSFPVGNYPTSVAVGDFNGDGKQDLAVVNYSSANVSILLGDGAGSFGARTDFATPTGPFSVAIGDFNGDGKQDLAVVNYDSNNVSIFLGTGTGNFSPPNNFPSGNATPSSVAVVDLNNDGKQDLAIPNDASGIVAILLGDGTGNFSAPNNFNSGPGCARVAVGDFNRDGKQDLALANHGGPPPMTAPGEVAVLFGTGTGVFSGSTILGSGLGHPISVAVADFNDDTKQDLAVNMYFGLVSLFLGDGAGNFTGPITFNGSNTGGKTAVGDFNGDGKQDLAVTNVQGNNVSILMSTCTTLTPTPTPSPLPKV